MDSEKITQLTKKITQIADGYKLEAFEIKVSETEVYIMLKAKKIVV